jgi:transposase-like protein
MRPRGTRTHNHLTPAEKRKIVAITRKGGLKQIEIARLFGCGVDTVRAVRQAAGLKLFPELTPELEKAVVEALRSGKGQAPVSKQFRVSSRKIRALMKKHGITHRVGDPGLPLAKKAKILERVCRREDFGNHIAQKEGVSRDTVLRVAHQIFGPHRFRNRGLPLTSAINVDANLEDNFQNFLKAVYRKRVSPEDKAMQYETIWRQFLEGYLERNHNGILPPDRSALISEVMSALFPAELQHFPIKGEIRGYIVKAVNSIAAQSGLVH